MKLPKMTSLSILAISLFLLCSLIPATHAVADFSPPAWANGFDHSAYDRGAILNPSDYVLFWSVNSDTREIKFAAIVKTMGWVGLGISSNGGMKGADIALLIQDSTGKLGVRDMWSNRTATPYLDNVQNKRLIAAETKQENGVTQFVFTRRLSACGEEDFPITSGPIWVIRAFGQDHNFAYHGSSARGAVRLDLLAPPAPALDSTGAFEIDIVQSPYNLTTETTQYVCSRHVLPNDRKYHVTIAKPIIGMHRVHHMILFKCTAPHNASSTAERCSSMTGSCIVFWTGWAVGGQDMVFPPDAGLPMGPDPSDPTGGNTYMLLQIHYDNPDQLTTLRDQRSGFKLVYTPILRKYDVGVLTLGAVDFFIPANTQEYVVRNECPGSCTRQFPLSGITVIGNGFHMHELGRSARLQHIRNGIELPPIGEQKYYDFEHQNIDPTIQLTRIMPEDRMILTCAWSSLGKTGVTRFGESTNQEMCFNFLTYYPKMDRFACFSIELLTGIALGVTGLSSTQQVAICAPELSLDSLTSVNSVRQILNDTKVFFNPQAGFTPIGVNDDDCARVLPLCGNDQVDTGEDCEKGAGCSACRCMQGLFSDRKRLTCSTEPVAIEFLETKNGIAVVASWAVAGVFLILLLILIIAIVTRKKSSKDQALHSAGPKSSKILVESDSDSVAAKPVKVPSSPKTRNVRDAGSEDTSSGSDAGSIDEDDDSLESSSHAAAKLSPKVAKKSKKASSSSSSSSEDEDEEEESSAASSLQSLDEDEDEDEDEDNEDVEDDEDESDDSEDSSEASDATSSGQESSSAPSSSSSSSEESS